MYQHAIKPLFDFAFAFLLGLVSLPFLLLAILILILQRTSPIFLQKRIGKNERVFTIYKLTTMRDGQVTRVGRFFRKMGVDEIPQILNILKGELSLVGPRPLLPDYLDIYVPRHKKRHAIKPGITGLAQVNGRNKASWKKRLDLDVAYVENQSFLLDLKILLKTLSTLLSSSEGAMPINPLQKGYDD